MVLLLVEVRRYELRVLMWFWCCDVVDGKWSSDELGTSLHFQ
jgi:hypothetical protein